EDSERTPPERERKTPACPRSRSLQPAVTNALSIPRHAHAPAPSPSGGGRRAALRSRSSRTGISERQLRRASVWRSAARRCTPVSAALYALLRPSVPLPLADLQTEASLDDLHDSRAPKRSNAVTLESQGHCMALY